MVTYDYGNLMIKVYYNLMIMVTLRQLPIEKNICDHPKLIAMSGVHNLEMGQNPVVNIKIDGRCSSPKEGSLHLLIRHFSPSA